MPNDKHRQSRPAGDTDLGGQRAHHETNITSGGVGPDESGFSASNRLGGLGNTSDGVASRDDIDPSVSGDHTMSGNIIDTNLAPTGTTPDTPDREG